MFICFLLLPADTTFTPIRTHYSITQYDPQIHSPKRRGVQDMHVHRCVFPRVFSRAVAPESVDLVADRHGCMVYSFGTALDMRDPLHPWVRGTKKWGNKGVPNWTL